MMLRPEKAAVSLKIPQDEMHWPRLTYEISRLAVQHTHYRGAAVSLSDPVDPVATQDQKRVLLYIYIV